MVFDEDDSAKEATVVDAVVEAAVSDVMLAKILPKAAAVATDGGASAFESLLLL